MQSYMHIFLYTHERCILERPEGLSKRAFTSSSCKKVKNLLRQRAHLHGRQLREDAMGLIQDLVQFHASDPQVICHNRQPQRVKCMRSFCA